MASLPHQRHMEKCYALVEALNAAVKAHCPEASILAYGSLASNLVLPDSDIDLCIVFDGVETRTCNKTWRAKVLKAVGDVIFSCNLVIRGTYQPILRARIPVITFRHKFTGLEVDINTFADGMFKAGFMRGLHAVDPRFGLLVRVVKSWARYEGINNPKDGTLNSFCLTLLCIYHMQNVRPPLLPPLWRFLPGGRGPEAPPSSQRPMHAGDDVPADCLEECLNAMRDSAPHSSGMHLDDLVHSFFMHMAAFLLLRFRGFGSMGSVTLSAWAGTLAPCKCRPTKGPGKKRRSRRSSTKQSAQGEPDREEASASAQPEAAAYTMFELFEHMIHCVEKHWPGSEDVSKGKVLANILTAASLMLSPADVAELEATVLTDMPTPSQSSSRRPNATSSRRFYAVELKLVTACVDVMLSSIVAAEDAATGLTEQQLDAMTRNGAAAADDDSAPLDSRGDGGQSEASSTTSKTSEDAGGTPADGTGVYLRTGDGRPTPARRWIPARTCKFMYRFSVEDPFNEEDNTARSLRSPELFRRVVTAFLVTALSPGSALKQLSMQLLDPDSAPGRLAATTVFSRASTLHLGTGAVDYREVTRYAQNWVPRSQGHRFEDIQRSFQQLVQSAARRGPAARPAAPAGAAHVPAVIPSTSRDTPGYLRPPGAPVPPPPRPVPPPPTVNNMVARQVVLDAVCTATRQNEVFAMASRHQVVVSTSSSFGMDSLNIAMASTTLADASIRGQPSHMRYNVPESSHGHGSIRHTQHSARNAYSGAQATCAAGGQAGAHVRPLTVPLAGSNHLWRSNPHVGLRSSHETMRERYEYLAMSHRAFMSAPLASLSKADYTQHKKLLEDFCGTCKRMAFPRSQDARDAMLSPSDAAAPTSKELMTLRADILVMIHELEARRTQQRTDMHRPDSRASSSASRATDATGGAGRGGANSQRGRRQTHRGRHHDGLASR